MPREPLIVSAVVRLVRFLRLWPGPTTPIGCLTNEEIDELEE